MPKLSSSILAADFANLEYGCRLTAEGGADYIHVDIMDGSFVPQITIGPPVVACLQKCVSLPLDCHLMVLHPERLVDELIDGGAEIITVHLESFENDQQVHETLKKITDGGVRAGLTLKPGTPEEKLYPFLKEISLLLIMTVEPGQGGQRIIPEMIERVQRMSEVLKAVNPECELEIDGGARLDNIQQLVKAGATVLVAGSAVFHGDITENSRRLKSKMNETAYN